MSSFADATAPSLKVGDTLAGRYRLVRLLGEGGMGYVWEGRHLTTDKAVAIKALKSETNADAARLLREARLSASLTHRNIVQVFDFWEPEGGGPVFMVMELLRGETLGAYLARVGRMPVEATLVLALSVTAAIRAAHAKGIVHRDLKPDNVFLTRSDEEGADGVPDIKVLDFGIAKPSIVDAQLTSLTRTGSVIGTPHYMAPEQVFAEKDIDGRVDVWALGVILYECLAGHKPFDGDNFGQVFRKVTQGQVVPLSDAAPAVPRSLGALVMTMLTLDPARRPTSSDVHAALAKGISTEPKDVAGTQTSGPSVTRWLPSVPAHAMPVAQTAAATAFSATTPRPMSGGPSGGAMPWTGYGTGNSVAQGPVLPQATSSVAPPWPGPVTGSTGARPQQSTKTAAIAVAGGLATVAAVAFGLFLASGPARLQPSTVAFGSVALPPSSSAPPTAGASAAVLEPTAAPTLPAAAAVAIDLPRGPAVAADGAAPRSEGLRPVSTPTATGAPTTSSSTNPTKKPKAPKPGTPSSGPDPLGGDRF